MAGEDPKELYLAIAAEFFRGIEFMAYDEKKKAKKKHAQLRKKRLAKEKKKRKSSNK